MASYEPSDSWTAAPRRRGRPRPAGLTARQAAVLRLVALGLTNKEIAARLRLSTHGVKKHLAASMRRYGAPNRAAALGAALLARELELEAWTTPAAPDAPAPIE